MPAVTAGADRALVAPRDWLLLLVPVLLAVAGVALRYAAYASVGTDPSPRGFVDALCVWDCIWFADIAQHGYQAYPEVLNFGGPAGIANWAFFPLYPLLASALQHLAPLRPQTIGTLLSPLLVLAAVLVSRPLFNGERKAYLLFATIVLIGPFSVYFTTLYSESLFFLLTVLGFVLLQQRRHAASGVAGAMLSATRVTGVIFVLAQLVDVFVAHRRDGGAPLAFPAAVLRRPDLVLGLVLAPAGLLAFMAFLYWRTGDALAFAHIQRGWDRALGNPLGFLLAGLDPRPKGWFTDLEAMAFVTIGGFVMCGVLAWQRRYAMAVFCVVAMLAGLSSGLVSMPRFVAGLAPIWIALAVLLSRYRPLLIIALMACVALDFKLTVLWIAQQRALM